MSFSLQGSAAKAAYKHKSGSDWNAAAVSLGDGDQFEYATETVVPDAQLTDSDQITGSALTGPSEIGQIIVSGDLAGIDIKFEGHERFLADIFGDTGSPAVQAPSTIVYQRKMTYASSNDGRFGTMAIQKVAGDGSGNDVHEIDSLKPMGLTIVGAPGTPTKMTLRTIGRQLRKENVDEGNRVNNSSSSWTLPGNGAAPITRRPFRFGETHIYIAAVTGSPLTPPDLTPDAVTGLLDHTDSGDYTALCASGFTLSFQRNGDPVPTTCSGDYADEPATDTNELTGQFDFPVYDDDNDFLVTANILKTVLTAVIVFDTDEVIDVANPGKGTYRMVLWLPGFQLTGGYPSINGKGRVPLSAQFKLHNAETAVDTDAKQPRLYIYNTIADMDDYGNS